ncbi:MAG: hypothetical protein HY678_04090, partial [Chloroflexi bacterium]|nr:hypothetical protein [Chloroflexota bacterium]
MREVIDASKDNAQSMWNLLEYRSAAQWLAGSGVITAYLSAADYSIDGLMTEFGTVMVSESLLAASILDPALLISLPRLEFAAKDWRGAVYFHKRGMDTSRSANEFVSTVVTLAAMAIIA